MSEENKQDQIITSVDGYIEQYSGPIPPPKMLRDYEQVLSGSADRILSMAEYEQKHRTAYEKRSVLYAFILALGLIALSFYAVSLGYALAGVGVIASSIFTVAGVFVHSQRSGLRELQARRKAAEKLSLPPQPQLPDENTEEQSAV